MSLVPKLLRALLVLLVLAVLALGSLWALVHNEAATARLLGLLPGVHVVAPQGALLGDFKAERVEVALPRGGRLTLMALAWQGLHLRADANARWHLGVTMAGLQVRRLDLLWVPDPVVTPTVEPTDLVLPVSLQVGRVQVGEAHSSLWGAAPLEALDASLVLGAQHHLQLHNLAWSGWAAQGEASVGAASPIPVVLSLKLSQAEAQASLQLSGPLRAMALSGEARWQAKGAGHGPVPLAQFVSLSGALQPFMAWPLPHLAAQAKDLNLAALWPGLPQTRLAGSLSLAPDGAEDLLAKVALSNGASGAWNNGALPMRALTGSLRWRGALKAGGMSTPLETAQVALQAELPSVKALAPAKLALTGDWVLNQASFSLKQAHLRLTIDGLTLQALDERAPPLRLAGALSLLPGATTASAASGATGSQVVRTVAQADVRGEVGPAYMASTSAAGRRLVTRPVSLSLRGELGADALRLQSVQLLSQAQEAVLSEAVLRWQKAPDQPAWAAEGKLKVAGFDPRVWLPWPEAITGPHELAGEASFALDARWRGRLDARLIDSVLGGVPLSGQVHWLAPIGGKRASLQADLDAAGNVAQAQGAWPLGAQDEDAIWTPQQPGQQWQLGVKADDLRRLQVLAPLLGASRLAGEVQVQARFQGRWPEFGSEGQVALRHVVYLPQPGSPGQAASSAQSLQMDDAQAAWQLDTRSLNAPASFLLKLQNVRLGDTVLSNANWTLAGSGRAHSTQLLADLSWVAKAPPGKETKASPTTSGVPQTAHLAFSASGAVSREGRGWQGQVGELLVQAGKAASAPPKTLLQAQPFDVAVAFTGAHRQGLSLSLSPTRMQLMGADLQIKRFQGAWPERSDGAKRSPADLGEWDIQWQLMPLNVAALLACLQPQRGWGGDLLVGGEFSLLHSPGRPWEVDAQLQRQSGDISLSEPTIEGNSQQRLGIREAKVVLQARHGVWTLTEQFEGRVLGQLSGRQVVQSAVPEQLPTLSAPLSGSLDLQIGSLGPWAVWAPAGWRLSGQVQAQADLSGTLGVPRYRGQVKGQNLGLGQALLGVDLTQGQLAMTLDGAQARLTHFEARGGSQGGLIRADGEAQLGEQPQATLRVQAERFALLQRVDRRIVISGQVQATLGAEDIGVNGSIGVDEGLIDISQSDAPTIGDDVNVLNRPGQAPDEEADSGDAAPAKRRLSASVDVDLGHKLRLKGRGIDTLLTGALRFTTPNNRPTLTGTVKTERGTYAAYGQKLRIERGSIIFTGPIENPRLDILAMRPQSSSASTIVSQTDVKVGVSITGTAMDPRVSLYSDPTLTETEKLSWLVLGRAPSGLGGADIGLLQTAAVALLSGEKASPQDSFMGMFGLDELSVRQSDNTTVRDTVVNVGKQVSKYWYVGYERNLNATGGSWQLIYRLGQRLTLRAQAGEDNALDLIRSWRWD